MRYASSTAGGASYALSSSNVRGPAPPDLLLLERTLDLRREWRFAYLRVWYLLVLLRTVRLLRRAITIIATKIKSQEEKIRGAQAHARWTSSAHTKRPGSRRSVPHGQVRK